MRRSASGERERIGRRRVELEAVDLPRGLDAGALGVAAERIRLGAVLGRDRDADRDADEHALRAGFERLLECGSEPDRGERGEIARLEVGQQDHERAFADAVYRIDGAQRAPHCVSIASETRSSVS